MMNTDLKPMLIRLAKGELLQMHDAQGKGVAVFEGAAWITQDNDPRDHILSRGETFTFDRPGLAIVQALSSGGVLLFEMQAAPEARQGSHAGSAPAARPARAPGASRTVAETDRAPRLGRSSVEWYLEARSQRAEAIGSAMLHAVQKLRGLWNPHSRPGASTGTSVPNGTPGRKPRVRAA